MAKHSDLLQYIKERRSLRVNKIIILIIQGKDYNHTYKWNSHTEFLKDVANNNKVPKPNDMVVEAYIDDNLIDAGNTFNVTLNKLKLILL